MEIIQKIDNSKEPKKEYVLLTGKHIGVNEDGDQVRYEPGDLVPLTKQQFDHDFKDKFVKVDDRKPAIFSPAATTQSGV